MKCLRHHFKEFKISIFHNTVLAIDATPYALGNSMSGNVRDNVYNNVRRILHSESGNHIAYISNKQLQTAWKLL
jgi:hypothetical protein